MIWSTQPPERHTAADAGFSDHVRAFLGSALGYIRARLELAGLESREAFAVYGKIIGLLIAAIVFLLFGYVLLWIGLVALLGYLTGAHWGWFTLGASLLHFIGTALCLWAIKAGVGQPVFTETLKEFRKDQEWLNTPHAKRN